jgi:type II secretory pathway pseudopilin PulG
MWSNENRNRYDRSRPRNPTGRCDHPGDRGMLSTLGAPTLGALIRAAQRWRSLRFTEFELRQIAAVRTELDQEYEDSIAPLARSSQPCVSIKSAPWPHETYSKSIG